MVNPLITNLLSAVIGGIFVGILLYIFREKRERRSLRLALLSELYAMHLNIGLISREELITPDLSSMSTTIYTNNASSIGLLSPSEVLAVVNFYSWLDQMIPFNQRVINKAISGDKMRDVIHNNHITLKDLWESAMNELSSKISDKDIDNAGFVEPEFYEIARTDDRVIPKEVLEEFGITEGRVEE